MPRNPLDVLAQQLVALASRLLEEIAKPFDSLPVWQVDPASKQSLERIREVTGPEQVVAKRRQQLLRVEVGELLAPIPRRIVVAGAAHVSPSSGRGPGPRRRPC